MNKEKLIYFIDVVDFVWAIVVWLFEKDVIQEITYRSDGDYWDLTIVSNDKDLYF